MSLAAKMLRPPSPEEETAGLLRSHLPTDLAAEIIHRLTTASAGRPIWVAETKELWWAGRKVKTLHRAADNQARVLAAFEAAGWPRRLDDPLPRVAGRNAKVRRRDTARSLNEGLAPGTIRFHADGMGGIHWDEVVDAAETSPSHHP